MKTQATFSELLQAYFTQRLMHECNASPHTIANYRDAFRLLIGFAHRNLKKHPTVLAMQDLDASFVCRFLDHLEKDRGVSARSRNVRLAAIHSFFHYVALQEPALGALAQRVLAIKSKRHIKRSIDFLTRKEAEALLAAPNQQTWSGRRDHRPALSGHCFGHRRTRALHRQRAQITLRSLAQGNGRDTPCVATGAKRPARRDTLSKCAWQIVKPGRSSISAGQASGLGATTVSVSEKQTRHSARPATQHGDGITPIRCGSFRHLSVARTRTNGHDTDLPPRQPRTEGKGARQDGTVLRTASAIPPARSTDGIPAKPLIMPSRRNKKGVVLQRSEESPRELGITRS
jgi:hypothetical protein